MPADSPPYLRGGRRGRVDSAVLVLHGGQEESLLATGRLQASYLRMLDFYYGLRQRSHRSAVYLLRYRSRGWNARYGPPAPLTDARWALERIVNQHPNVPVALLGHSMGGRVAVALAAEPSVAGVCALAPWLPPGEPLPVPPSTARFVLAHGTADRVTSSAASAAYAERLRADGSAVARFELLHGRHALLDDPRLWHRFAVLTTLGLAGDRPLPVGVTRALDDGDGTALRRPLAAFDGR